MAGEIVAGLFVVTSWGLPISSDCYEQRMAALQQWSTLEVLARTIYGEASSDGLEGMLGVGWVILNRADHGGWWGESVKEVCLKPKQFSCWRRDNPQLEHLVSVNVIDPEYALAYQLAHTLLSGVTGSDPTAGATYFHAAHVSPPWALTLEYATTIGNHLFYRRV